MRTIGEGGSFDRRIPQLVSAVSERIPTFKTVLSRHGNLTLGQYAETIRVNESSPIQDRQEVIDAVLIEARRTLVPAFGDAILTKLQTQLTRFPGFLTGNHHGPDYAPQMHQGTQIYSLAVDADSVVPVLACATIPMDSKGTHPGSIRLADERRVNVFSVRGYSKYLVAATPAFTPKMVAVAKESLATQQTKKEPTLSRREAETIDKILTDCYAPVADLDLANYSDQSVALNSYLWDKASQKPHPD